MSDEDENIPEDTGKADDVAESPNDAADPKSIVEAKIPRDIRDCYEVYSYRNAAIILSETRKKEFGEILNALRSFSITTQTIKTAGGNETEIPKNFSAALRPLGWQETRIRGDLNVTLTWREQVGVNRRGKPVREEKSRILTRKNYLDGHKIDYVKEKVAFDLEWNSKDQTFDRDLYAFNAFFLAGAIDAGILLTRSAALNDVFKSLGIMSKYGASTTWMGKLLYRLNAGRNGGCPVLVFGITPKCVSDWKIEKKK